MFNKVKRQSLIGRLKGKREEQIYKGKVLNSKFEEVRLYDPQKVGFRQFVQMHGGTFSTRKTELGNTLMKWWNHTTGQRVMAYGKDFPTAYENLLFNFNMAYNG